MEARKGVGMVETTAKVMLILEATTHMIMVDAMGAVLDLATAVAISGGTDQLHEAEGCGSVRMCKRVSDSRYEHRSVN